MSRRLTVVSEEFPIAGQFTIARGSRTKAVVVVATIASQRARGRGECVPYAHYGESVEGVIAAIESVRTEIEAGADRHRLAEMLPAGAARNALDCALWDFEAKESGIPAHVLAGFDRLRPLSTAYTISLDAPDAMAAAAARVADRPILKIKLGAADGADPARIAAVRAAVPDATLLADANEGWSEASIGENMAACAQAGVALIEQPLPAGRDACLADMTRAIPVCADESLHVRGDLAGLVGRYDAINIKLDKAGGLTEALALAEEASRLGLAIMAGSMVGTSLAMAPAVLVGQRARFVDLDGPLLLARDRDDGLVYRHGMLLPPAPVLWG